MDRGLPGSLVGDYSTDPQNKVLPLIINTTVLSLLGWLRNVL